MKSPNQRLRQSHLGCPQSAWQRPKHQDAPAFNEDESAPVVPRQNDHHRNQLCYCQWHCTQQQPRTGHRKRGAVQPLKAADALVLIVNTVHESNLNLTKAKNELLHWHYRLGHVGSRRVQFVLRSGVVSKTAGSRRLQTAACVNSTDAPFLLLCTERIESKFLNPLIEGSCG